MYDEGKTAECSRSFPSVTGTMRELKVVKTPKLLADITWREEAEEAS